MSAVVWETNFPGLKLLSRGKVRDLYEVGGDLLLVATDRLSAFDVVLPTPIPDKGRVLTQLSLFWFETLRDVVPNHVLSATRVSRRSASAFQRAIGGPLDALPQDPAAAHRMRRARLSGRLGMEGLSRDGQSLRHRAAAGLARIRPAARSRFSRHPPRPPRATTKIFPSTRRSRASAARAPSSFARSAWKSTGAPRRMPSLAASCWPTPSLNSA